MSDGNTVQIDVLKMINLINQLEQSGFVMDGEISQDLILQSLSDCPSQFFVNFHIKKLDVSLTELLKHVENCRESLSSKKDQVLLIDDSFQLKEECQRHFTYV